MSTEKPSERDPNAPPPSELSGVEKQVLAFAALHWKYFGAMETAIREKFGWSTIRYFQVLNHLLEQPEAHAHDPLTVSRLRGSSQLRVCDPISPSARR